jgi:hypothetical protein
VRVINHDGELLAEFTINPTKQYRHKTGPDDTNDVRDVTRHPSGMSRDTTQRARRESNPQPSDP